MLTREQLFSVGLPLGGRRRRHEAEQAREQDRKNENGSSAR